MSRLRRLARPAPRRRVVLLSNNKLLKAADGPGATASGACVALAASALLRGWERCWLLAEVCGSGKQLLRDCRRDLPSAHAGPAPAGMRAVLEATSARNNWWGVANHPDTEVTGLQAEPNAGGRRSPSPPSTRSRTGGCHSHRRSASSHCSLPRSLKGEFLRSRCRQELL